MFKGLGNFAEIFKQVGQFKAEMERANEELKRVVLEGSAGGGLVKIRMNGKQEALDCHIDRQLLADGDAELLGDLVTAALNQAMEKARAAATERVSKVTGGLSIPGLQDALGRLSIPALPDGVESRGEPDSGS